MAAASTTSTASRKPDTRPIAPCILDESSDGSLGTAAGDISTVMPGIALLLSSRSTSSAFRVSSSR